MYNQTEITFLNDLVLNDSVDISIEVTSIVNDYTWIWVNSLANSFEVLVGSPSGVSGSVTAINFSNAFDADLNSSNFFTITVLDNVVTIVSNVVNVQFLSESYIFESSEGIPHKIINVRSPYFITAPIYNGTTEVDPTEVTFELKIWEGDVFTDKPTGYNFEYKKTPRYIGDKHFYIDISNQIRDEIQAVYDSNLANKCVFVEVDISSEYDGGVIDSTKKMIAFDGYGNHKEGLNPSVKDVMLNNRSITQLSGSSIYLPIYKGGDDYIVEFRNNTTVLETVNVTGVVIDNTNNAVQVIKSDEYTTNNIRIQNTTQTTEFVIDVEQLEECIYTPVRCVFLNKQGVLQEMYFFKSNKESLDVTKKDYKANILNETIVNNVPILSYDNNSHNKKKYNTQANKSIELNTGYIPEDNNIIIEELLLSEYVWLEVNDIVYPVDTTTKSQEYLTKINDQLIKYAIKFDYSFDVVQNIR